MKITKFLLTIFVFVIMLAGAVSADRFVDYQFREATFNSDGSITYSTNPLTDVSAIGFVCNDNHCETVSGNLWGGAVQNSGVLDTMQLTYPTTLQSSYGYGVYYYKPGYITWEQNPDWWGTTATDPQGPYNRYLAKIETCNAPIDTFTILNDVQPNVPLVIEIEASLDATAYSAIHNAGPLKYTPSALQNEYYSVETEITLDITKFNTLIDRQTVTVNIPYSSSSRVEFTWIPEVEGDYKATVTTDVTDDKCSSSVEQSAISWFTVIEEDPKDMCYTLLNDLAISNQFPYEGETVTISASKISNYADGDYVLSPVDTLATMTVTRRADNVVVYTGSQLVAANPNAQDVAGLNFNWDIPAVTTGWYDVKVHAIGQDTMCRATRPNLDETELIEVYVTTQPNSAPTLAGIPDQSLNENQAAPANWIDLWQYASDPESADADLQFSLVSQSNANLINCNIANDRYVNCGTPAYNQYGYSDVTIEVSDGLYTDRDTFRITINRVNNYPIISNIPNVRFDIGDEFSIDLDHYTHDPDNSNDELTWTWTGDDDVEIDFDSTKHIVTFSGRRHWSGDERITFTVTDPDGLTDSDISIVYIDVPKPEADDIMVTRVRSTDYMLPGDIVVMNIGLESNTYEDLGDLRITAVMPELGTRAATETFELDGRGEENKNIYLQIPKWAAPGLYDIRLTISNDDIRRVLHRDVRVI